ncbi:lytic transglycosylase domain-containing protein [Paenibacillus agri]|uniref:Lytic transglycosylase domain-containing protein n=1 Tax=Paenibacillus agri TaxID=2744309 RepID=A0A850EX03_9BACL|nr:lytic transglycosylase domain-containing protein [Paenibacillus agri]NUU62381.1 lytic transglycosylase domain-containing protein [Paenibacillus agri]
MGINPVQANGAGQLKWVNLKTGAVTGPADKVKDTPVTGKSSAVFSAMLQEGTAQGDSLRSLDSAAALAGMAADSPLLWQNLGAQSSGSISGEITGTKSTDYEDLIQAASAKYGVPVDLIKAVIDTESSFNPNVVSSAGAKGLMQLMDGTASGLGVSNPFDPAQSIDGGVRYLSYQLQRFGGEERMALAAYNAGPGRVTKLGVSNDQELMANLSQLPKETQAYIYKIERARAQYAV